MYTRIQPERKPCASSESLSYYFENPASIHWFNTKCLSQKAADIYKQLSLTTLSDFH